VVGVPENYFATVPKELGSYAAKPFQLLISDPITPEKRLRVVEI